VIDKSTDNARRAAVLGGRRL